jgi:hypothetical protein
MHRLATDTQGHKFALAVRWLLTGNEHLCGAIALVLRAAERDQPFNANMENLGLTGSEQIVVCHKALAYLPLQPVICASIVVAALRCGDSDVREDLIELLVFPILVNYQGEARSYLAGIKKSDPAFEAVKEALHQGDAYTENASLKVPVKELWPSDYQRNVAAMKRYDRGREIRKMAERQSIFFNLVHRSTLLYGRKALTFANGADKAPVALEMKPMSIGFDMPRLDTIDPVGLDHMLRVFRVSKPK